MKLHSTLPPIIVALVFLDSTSSLSASDCCYNRRQKRDICVDSNEDYQFEDQEDEKHETRRQTRDICIDSNEDFAEFVDFSDIPNSFDYECKCGVNFLGKKEKRIAGGTDALPGEMPWQVQLHIEHGSIETRDIFRCGGSLLSSDTVLTAAHCVLDSTFNFTTNERMIIPLPKEKLKIVVGDHTRSKNEGTEQIVRVKDYFPHPSYQKNVTHDNDFAIIKLANEVKFTKYVNPICLPQTSSNFESVETTASGWGSLQELYSGTHDILQKVDLKTMSNAKCNLTYAKYEISLTSNMICATDTNKNVCKGDSGGPLAVFDQTYNYWTVIGVSSFVSPAALLSPLQCKVNESAVFARVTAQLDWINLHVGETCPRPS